MYIIITASPNKDGLTAACGKAAYNGITGAGGKAEVIGITRFNREIMLQEITSSAARMVKGEFFGVEKTKGEY